MLSRASSSSEFAGASQTDTAAALIAAAPAAHVLAYTCDTLRRLRIVWLAVRAWHEIIRIADVMCEPYHYAVEFVSASGVTRRNRENSHVCVAMTKNDGIPMELAHLTIARPHVGGSSSVREDGFIEPDSAHAQPPP